MYRNLGVINQEQSGFAHQIEQMERKHLIHRLHTTGGDFSPPVLLTNKQVIDINKVIDLSGKKFGRLTVVERGEDYIQPNGKKAPQWECCCECGNTVLIRGSALRNGTTRSCGCLSRERASRDAVKNLRPKIADIAGVRFGRLIALEPIFSVENDGVVWLCRCDCGNTTEVPAKMLNSGNTKSCGCLRSEIISNVNRIHSKSHSRLYNVWNGMRQRCNDPNHKSYHNYGGRGIRVCEEWQDFVAFQTWALQSGYDINAEYGICTIERRDVDGDYEPSNCCWVTMAEQAKNKRKKN